VWAARKFVGVAVCGFTCPQGNVQAVKCRNSRMSPKQRCHAPHHANEKRRLDTENRDQECYV